MSRGFAATSITIVGNCREHGEALFEVRERDAARLVARGRVDGSS